MCSRDPLHHFFVTIVCCGASVALPTCHGADAAPTSGDPVPAGAAMPAVVAQGAPAPAAKLTGSQTAALETWFSTLGPRRDGERFGDLIVRAARVQLGKPYELTPEGDGVETLRVALDRFECVSLVETTLAVTRCVWRANPDAACFLRELEAWRYRGGHLVDFASRLHYFPDWIDDNERRGRVRVMTDELGGEPARFVVDYMSRHRALYPPMKDDAVLATISAIESRLSATDLVVIPRDRILGMQRRLENGDVIAIVSDLHPGVAVGHAGFVDLGPHGLPRLLHAASFQKRVLVTAQGLADYMLRRQDRRAISVVRPLPPP
jgi:hypothetical protein